MRIESQIYEVKMIIFRETIGKLKDISYEELQTIIKNMPCDWDYDYKSIFETGVGKRYNLRIYRKPN